MLKDKVLPLPLPISDSIDGVERKIYIFNKVFGDINAIGPGAAFGEWLL